MPHSTRATLALSNLGVRFTLHTYGYDPHAERIGLQAADALGVEARRMLKTLMAEVDGKPVCVITPADREVSMKKLAAAFHGKTARMPPVADAERLTGYHVGGISPFAQKKRVPVAIEQTALAETSIYINGRQRGLHRAYPGRCARCAWGDRCGASKRGGACEDGARPRMVAMHQGH
jgi:Cys-tRNA(Pro)/Cys-tRNA(Cys) deacylase